MAVTYTIEKYVDGDTVNVSFKDTEKNIIHERTVNAVFNDLGKYDKKATIARVEEVARGVENKIKIRAIKPVPVEESTEE